MPNKEELARRAWELIIKLHESQNASFEREAERLGLSQVTGYALHVLSEMPPGPISQLATKLGVDPGWVTDIVDRLEEYGAVVRRQSDEDRRVRVVELTGAGRRVASQIRDSVLMMPPALLELHEGRLRLLLNIAEELDRIARKKEKTDLGAAIRDEVRRRVDVERTRAIERALRPRMPRGVARDDR